MGKLDTAMDIRLQNKPYENEVLWESKTYPKIVASLLIFVYIKNKD